MVEPGAPFGARGLDTSQRRQLGASGRLHGTRPTGIARLLIAWSTATFRACRDVCIAAGPSRESARICRDAGRSSLSSGRFWVPGQIAAEPTEEGPTLEPAKKLAFL